MLSIAIVIGIALVIGILAAIVTNNYWGGALGLIIGFFLALWLAPMILNSVPAVSVTQPPAIAQPAPAQPVAPAATSGQSAPAQQQAAPAQAPLQNGTYQLPVGATIKPIDGNKCYVTSAQPWVLPKGTSGSYYEQPYVAGETVPAGYGTVWGCSLLTTSSGGGVQYNAAPAPAKPAVPSSVPSVGCEPAQKIDFVPVPSKPWVIEGNTWRILNGWSNWTDPNQGDFKTLLPPGTKITLKGGGSLFTRPATCESATKAEFAGNQLPELTINQLRQKGLIN